MEAATEQRPSEQALRQGYEPSTLYVKGLMWFLVFFFLTAIIVHYGMWYLEKCLLSQPRSDETVASAVASLRQFPNPDVQPSEAHDRLPWEDMAALRQAEAARFAQLGWKADPATGSAQIPDAIVAKLAEAYRAKSPGQNALPAVPVPPGTQPATLPTTNQGGQP